MAQGFLPKSSRAWGAVLACAALFPLACNLPAAAQAPGPAPVVAAGGPSWASLSPAQREALKPLERDWPLIDPPRKQKWVELSSRFDRMTPEERSRVQQRMTDWVRLSPKQRNEARLNFQDAKGLSSQERQDRWEAYKALPEDQRRDLATQAKGSTKATTPTRAQKAAASQSATKVNTVPNPLLESPKPRAVAPTLMQAQPGATTNLMSTKAQPPLHQQPGLPKVAATPEFVDSTTLLPQRGPQGAATEPRRKP